MSKRGEGAIQTEIPTGVIASVAGKARNFITGVADTWFGPGQPLAPVAPGINPPRILDYDFAVNYNFIPKANDGSDVVFSQMRALADNYDLLRLVIETRKDQVSKIPFIIRKKTVPGMPVGKKVTSLQDASETDPRAKQLYEFFEYPDGEHPWQSWIRAVLEEVFVVDALTICPRKNRKGDVLALDVIDGATICRKIDAQGRTPTPPNPAYQQIIKGMPMADFTTDELIYRPRNYRVHKIYGYSPVEQIILTINLALRRQMSKLAYYTDGNIPEALASVPETWSADEITRFQNMFDSMKGDVQAQRRLRFIPQLHQFIPTKDAMLKDEMDEWLARVVCYALSVSPMPFTKSVNRASAQVSMQTALAEGLLPILVWLSQVMNYIIKRYFKIEDLEFAWKINNETDGLKLSQIHDTYAKDNILSVDEIREELGRDPVAKPIDNGLNPKTDGRPNGPTGMGQGEQAGEMTAAGDTNSGPDTH